MAAAAAASPEAAPAAPAPSPVIVLTAGALSVLLDGPELRSITIATPCGPVEVLRGIYAAVRDRSWGTVVPRVEQLTVDQGKDCFSVSFVAVCQRPGPDPVDFAWRASIRGEAPGATASSHHSLVFQFDGQAHADFLRNRIGFCVLHGAENAGRTAVVHHIDGSTTQATFGELVDPDQPVGLFANVRAIDHSPAPGVQVSVRMDGDTFETEDQRNWTDSSWKTFCTPLARPFPVPVHKGDRVQQTVTVSVTAPPAPPCPRRAFPEMATVTVLPETTASCRLPLLGYCLPSDGGPLSDTEAAHLRRLRPAHLRADWHASRPSAESDARLQRARADCLALGAGLELALFLDPADEPLLAHLCDFFRQYPDVRPSRVLVFTRAEHYHGGSPIRGSLEAVRRAMAHLQAPIAAGTDSDFIFFGRNRPPMDLCDAVTFSVNPQVHAFDNRSIVETLPGQRAVVATAAAHSAGKPVFVSTVTLKARYNPFLSAPPSSVPEHELPPQVDVRQRSPFAAGWTLGSVAALAAAGAASATFYETAGPLGVMERESGSRWPALFPSTSLELFPVFAVFEQLARLTDCPLVPTEASDPHLVTALAFREERRGSDAPPTIALLIASHSPEPLLISLQGFQAQHLRHLTPGDEAFPAASPVLLAPYATILAQGIRAPPAP